MATYNGNNTVDVTKLAKGDVITFAFTGASKNITLPAGTYKLQVWGAQGGTYNSYTGGAGGYSVGTITLSAPTTVYAYVGGQPTTNSTQPAQTAGGFNGGGAGYNRSYSGTYSYGQGGGGATDFRIGGETLYHRVIVAGGGGGSSSVAALTTKYGGGTNGGSPQSGYGASQTAAGTNGGFGTGGAATTSGGNYKYGSGGGGGGWYGGGACSSYSDTSNYQGYNGGGSGFVWTGQTVPSAYQLGAEYQLTEAATYAGNTSFPSTSGSSETGHQGNGYAQIGVIALPSKGCDVYIKRPFSECFACGPGCDTGYVNLTGSDAVGRTVNMPNANFIKKGGKYWIAGTSETDTSKTGLYWSDNGVDWNQLDISTEFNSGTGSGYLSKVYGADYHDGLWVVIGIGYDDTSIQYLLIFYAEESNIKKWTLIKDSISNTDESIGIQYQNGLWIKRSYSSMGGISYSVTPKVSSSWVTAESQTSTVKLTTCYDIQYFEAFNTWVACGKAGIWYSIGDLQSFVQSPITSSVKKVVSSYGSIVAISDNAVYASGDCANWATIVSNTSYTINDIACVDTGFLIATSDGLYGLFDMYTGLVEQYPNVNVTAVRTSNNSCAFITTNGYLYVSAYDGETAVNWQSGPCGSEGCTFIYYDASEKWYPATAVYKKVNGAWKKADSVLLKTDGMWEPSNVTPYEIELPFIVACRNCSASDKFTFQLKDSNDNVVDTVNSTGAETSATFYFKKLSFKKAGTFTYFASQVEGTDTNIAYDAVSYKVVFTLAFDATTNSIVCSDLAVTDATTNAEAYDGIYFVVSNRKPSGQPDPS